MTRGWPRYLAWASRREVLWISGALSVVLFGLLGTLFPPSVIEPIQGVEAARAALENAADRRHVISVLTLDSLFPLAYTTLFCGLLYRSALFKNRLWVFGLPMGLCIWDFAENMQLAALHSGLVPSDSDLVVYAVFFGGVKFALLACILGLLIVALIVYLRRRRSGAAAG
ncbi:MAG: hypothetical protein ACPGUC_03140 [Gammaproteobacteria bacterium]